LRNCSRNDRSTGRKQRMPSCLVTCPMRSRLRRGQDENALSTFLTLVGVMAVEEEVAQTSLVRKRRKDDAGKIALVVSEVRNV